MWLREKPKYQMQYKVVQLLEIKGDEQSDFIFSSYPYWLKLAFKQHSLNITDKGSLYVNEYTPDSVFIRGNRMSAGDYIALIGFDNNDDEVMVQLIRNATAKREYDLLEE